MPIISPWYNGGLLDPVDIGGQSGGGLLGYLGDPQRGGRLAFTAGGTAATGSALGGAAGGALGTSLTQESPLSAGGVPSSGGGLFDFLGNISPAILAGYLGNKQHQEIAGQVGKLNTLGDSLNSEAFMKSITDPYDLQTGLGRTSLSNSLNQRDVGGSSFGNQQLGNFDYMRGVGRGDLATRAGTQIAQTQGGLYSDALKGMVGNNFATNQLYGAGLGASGSLFNKGGSTGNGIFDWLKNYFGGSLGSGGSSGSLPTDPNGGGQVDFGNDPSLGGGSSFDPNIDWSNLYG